jgi:acyl-CoA synthetase (AMP-forming)/AMP-acid ligase II
MSWIAQLLARGRERYGARTAIAEGDRSVSYRDLDTRTDSLASALIARGVRKGDRVLVRSHNRIEVLETYFALGKVGAVAVPLHYGHVAHEVAEVIEQYGVRMVIGERGLLPPAEDVATVLEYDSDDYAWAIAHAPGDLPAEVSDEDPLFVLQTSATTGRPKGVLISHRSLHAMTAAYLADVHPGDDCVLLHCGPLSHGAVMLALVYMAAGATMVLSRMFSPLDCLATIDRAAVTHLFVVPEMVRFLLRTGMPIEGRLPGLREIIYSAAPMPRQLLLDARAAFGCDFRQVWGITEGGPVATLPPEDHDYTPGEARGPAAAVGRSVLGVTVRSLDASGAPTSPGIPGELWVKTPGRMLGYWRDEAASADVLRESWLRTGDLGTVDERGYVYLAGRAKEVINRGGQKILPAEIEHILLGHAGVREAAVVGVPDEDWGEVPIAYVTAAQAEPELATVLGALLREQLARYKRPSGVLILDELPRTPIGKIDRGELRRRAVAGVDDLVTDGIQGDRS